MVVVISSRWSKKQQIPALNSSFRSSTTACSTVCDESLFHESDFVLQSPKLAKKIVKVAQRTLLKESQPLVQSPKTKVPIICHDDMLMGEFLGVGAFGLVHEVQVLDRIDSSDRMVCKLLKPQRSLHDLVSGCHQLELEKQTLQTLDHPNIIRLRGSSRKGIDSIAKTERLDSCFLLLDYLPETLVDRIDSWRQTNHDLSKRTRSLPVWKKTSKANKLNMNMLREQLKVAIDIASALQYLHQKRIILRDLKPDNIGFDENGTVKLFDFGLAAHLPADCDLEETHAGLGLVGTPRYMATEVTREEPYNHKADVFSFSLVLWQMLTQEKPNKRVMSSTVYGDRPALPKHWPSGLCRILSRGWSDDLSERPCMTEFKLVLEDLVRQHCP